MIALVPSWSTALPQVGWQELATFAALALAAGFIVARWSRGQSASTCDGCHRAPSPPRAPDRRRLPVVR